METTKKEVKKAGFPVLFIIVGIILSSLFIFSFAQIAEGLLESEVKAFDSAIIDYLTTLESDRLDQIMILITELGSVWFVTTLSIITVLLLWFKFKDKWGVLFFILSIGVGGLLTTLLKHYYQRGRPSINPEIDAVGFSFPSGHSMGSVIFYGFIIYLVLRSGLSVAAKWSFSILGVILFLLIGLSRIYLGAHFPTDVLAGQMAGAVWLILCLIALEWVEWRSENSVHPMKATRQFFKEIL